MNSRFISVFFGFTSPSLNSHKVRGPNKGTYSDMDKVNNVLLKLRYSLKNLVKFYIIILSIIEFYLEAKKFED